MENEEPTVPFDVLDRIDAGFRCGFIWASAVIVCIIGWLWLQDLVSGESALVTIAVLGPIGYAALLSIYGVTHALYARKHSRTAAPPSK